MPTLPGVGAPCLAGPCPRGILEELGLPSAAQASALHTGTVPGQHQGPGPSAWAKHSMRVWERCGSPHLCSPPDHAAWWPLPPLRPGRASICPVNGRPHPEPRADLLTQAGLPHPVPPSSIAEQPAGVVLFLSPREPQQTMPRPCCHVWRFSSLTTPPLSPVASTAQQGQPLRLPGGCSRASLPGLPHSPRDCRPPASVALPVRRSWQGLRTWPGPWEEFPSQTTLFGELSNWLGHPRLCGLWRGELPITGLSAKRPNGPEGRQSPTWSEGLLPKKRGHVPHPTCPPPPHFL